MRNQLVALINYRHLGQEPDVIDAADFSPQHRLRLYWHNFPFNPYMPLFENREDVQDKLTPNLNRKALCKKLRTVTSRSGSLLQGTCRADSFIEKFFYRRRFVKIPFLF